MLAQLKKNNTLKITISLALLFHVFGVIGMLSIFREWFVSMTSFTLFLMAFLLYISEERKDSALNTYIILSVFTGILAEVIGVNFGFLFGDYSYSDRLGVSWMGVPLIIGVQWFVTTYAMANLVNFIISYIEKEKPGLNFMVWQKVVVAALLTTLFDIILEPAAVKLGYWQWYPDGSVPLFNYISWYGVSLLLLTFFYTQSSLKDRKNIFAVSLAIIQVVFFLFLGWLK